MATVDLQSYKVASQELSSATKFNNLVQAIEDALGGPGGNDLVAGSGTVYFGSALDTSLFRQTVNQLKTQDAFLVESASGVLVSIGTNGFFRGYTAFGDVNPVFRVDATGQINLGVGGATATDVNLYRFAANDLRTDDKFGPASFISQVKAGVPVDGDVVGGAQSGAMVVDTTNSRIYVRVGATWKFVAVA